MKRCTLIYNPKSGRRKFKVKNYIPRINEIFLKYDYELEVISTEYKGHASDIMETLNDTDLVVSIGGDGTFNEIVTGNLKRNKPLLLAHIPTGTANDLGVMFGYGKDLIENVKLLLSGCIKKIDICTINNHPFVYCAGFGKFVNVSYETPRKRKERLGYLAYIIQVLKEFHGKVKMYDLEYEIDGKVFSGRYSFIMLSNANRIAGINNFYRDIKLNDYKFEVLFCKMDKKNDMLKSVLSLKSKDITKVPNLEFHKTDNLKIRFKDKSNKSWSIDGEEFKTGDLCEIKIVKDVEIMMPSKNVKKLFI